MTTRDQSGEVAGPSTATIKRLFARSGNRCAFPRCSSPIVEGMTVVGKICHIKARNEGGPRYDPLQTSAERHGYDNLILLCGRHHDVVDDDTVAYTVERLQKMKSAHEASTTLLASEEAEQGTQLLLRQSVSTTNQAGGITAQNVIIHYHPESAASRDPSERQTGKSVSPSSVRPSPNLAFVAFDAMPVSEAGSGLWTCEMGMRERSWATANGELALLARFINEPRRDLPNAGVLVKAQLIYRDQGHENRRIGGCWIDAPTDYAEFRVDESHELVIVVIRGAKTQTIAKRRVPVDLNSETIETKIDSLPNMQAPTVTIRLTNADTGDFLFEQEFRIDLRGLKLTAL